MAIRAASIVMLRCMVSAPLRTTQPGCAYVLPEPGNPSLHSTPLGNVTPRTRFHMRLRHYLVFAFPVILIVAGCHHGGSAGSSAPVVAPADLTGVWQYDASASAGGGGGQRGGGGGGGRGGRGGGGGGRGGFGGGRGGMGGGRGGYGGGEGGRRGAPGDSSGGRG